MILDTHQHFWKVERGDYHWMTSDTPAILRRDYLPEDLRPLLKQEGVVRTIAVQAAETEEETLFLLELAAETDFVAGVCGWLDMDSPAFPRRLEKLRKNPCLVSLRPMIQDKDDDRWILRPQVMKNLAYLNEIRFPFEILVYPKHLPAVAEALRQIPTLRSVINHIGKPPIKEGVFEPWATQIARLAEFPFVCCKLSGMTVSADIIPYVMHILNLFGGNRVMFGSDWPVARLEAEYGVVLQSMQSILKPVLGRDGLRKVLYTNGLDFYDLNLENK